MSIQDNLKNQILENLQSESDPYSRNVQSILEGKRLTLLTSFETAQEIIKKGKNALKNASNNEWLSKYHRNKKAIKLQKLVDPSINKVYALADPDRPNGALIPFDPDKYSGRFDNPKYITQIALGAMDEGLIDLTDQKVSEMATFIHNYGNTDFDRWFNGSNMKNISFQSEQSDLASVRGIIEAQPDVDDDARPKGIAKLFGRKYLMWVNPGGSVGAIENRGVNESIIEQSLPGFDVPDQTSPRNVSPEEYVQGMLLSDFLRRIMESPDTPSVWPRKLDNYDWLSSKLRVWMQRNIEDLKGYFEQNDTDFPVDLEGESSMQSAFGDGGIDTLIQNSILPIIEDAMANDFDRAVYEIFKEMRGEMDGQAFRQKTNEIMNARDIKTMLEKFEKVALDFGHSIQIESKSGRRLHEAKANKENMKSFFKSMSERISDHINRSNESSYLNELSVRTTSRDAKEIKIVVQGTKPNPLIIKVKLDESREALDKRDGNLEGDIKYKIIAPDGEESRWMQGFFSQDSMGGLIGDTKSGIMDPIKRYLNPDVDVFESRNFSGDMRLDEMQINMSNYEELTPNISGGQIKLPGASEPAKLGAGSSSRIGLYKAPNRHLGPERYLVVSMNRRVDQGQVMEYNVFGDGTVDVLDLQAMSLRDMRFQKDNVTHEDMLEYYEQRSY